MCTTACAGGVAPEIILRLSVEWDFEILTPEALSIMQSPITGSLDGKNVEWMEKVTDEQ